MKLQSPLLRVRALEALANPDCGWFYRIDADGFGAIPGSPIAYWASSSVRTAFLQNRNSDFYFDIKSGVRSGNNDRFQRFAWEVSQVKTCLGPESVTEMRSSKAKWYASNKGDGYRRWFGNNYRVVNWENDGFDIRNYPGSDASPTRDLRWIGRKGLTWGTISSAKLSMRASVLGAVPDAKGAMVFEQTDVSLEYALGLFNSPVAEALLRILSPTLDFTVGSIQQVPMKYESGRESAVQHLVTECIEKAQTDWDSFEASWSFKRHPLI